MNYSPNSSDDATVPSAADAAVELATAGWPVFPCRGKVPMTPHGFHDGTTDRAQIEAWWSQCPWANIATRVPDNLVVIDVDPRNGGDVSLEALVGDLGPLPETLTSVTGGGGEHLFFLRPRGELGNGAHKLGTGLDVKDGGKGYVILPPSLHPSGRRYRWSTPNPPIATLPAWLTAMLRPEPRKPTRPQPVRIGGEDRPGDLFESRAGWDAILEPAGWCLVGTRGEIRYWRRPGKTEGISATTNGVGTDKFHVFTSSAAPLEPDNSYSKFAAWTYLNCNGDFSEAARQLRQGVSL